VLPNAVMLLFRLFWIRMIPLRLLILVRERIPVGLRGMDLSDCADLIFVLPPYFIIRIIFSTLTFIHYPVLNIY